MRPLTPAQAKALEFVALFIEKHGYSPTYRDMCHRIGSKNSNAAAYMVTTLTGKGLLAKEPMISRSITVTDEGHAYLRGLREAKEAGG